MAEVTLAGTLSDGRGVRAITLRAGGLEACVLDYGARLVLFRRGDGPNACVTSADLGELEGRLLYAGPVIAPVINRIGGAAAQIAGRDCRFDANQTGRHTLHSGRAGTQHAIWEIASATGASATLTVDLPDGAGGFPGNRTVTAVYGLDPDTGLTLDIAATTDAATLINPGLHGVWNPDGSGEKAGLVLEIPAETYLPVDGDTLPTGAVARVAVTPYDHRSPRAPDATLDHNFCFPGGFGLRARLTGATGRTLEVHSDAPGLQAYAGGVGGIALEPQLWPDAPNHPDFPPILLAPGDTFHQRSRYVLLA